MDMERLENEQDSNLLPADGSQQDKNISSEDSEKSHDVSHISRFHKLQRGITVIFARLGLSTVKVLARTLLGIIKGIKFLCSEVWAFI